AEDGIRDRNVTGVQTCALPISPVPFGDHLVISRFEIRVHLCNHAGGMLEVAVHDDSSFSARLTEPCDDGRFLAEIAGEGNVSDVPAAETFYRLQCIIRRAIIDE